MLHQLRVYYDPKIEPLSRPVDVRKKCVLEMEVSFISTLNLNEIKQPSVWFISLLLLFFIQCPNFYTMFYSPCGHCVFYHIEIFAKQYTFRKHYMKYFNIIRCAQLTFVTSHSSLRHTTFPKRLTISSLHFDRSIQINEEIFIGKLPEKQRFKKYQYLLYFCSLNLGLFLSSNWCKNARNMASLYPFLLGEKRNVRVMVPLLHFRLASSCIIATERGKERAREREWTVVHMHI